MGDDVDATWWREREGEVEEAATHGSWLSMLKPIGPSHMVPPCEGTSPLIAPRPTGEWSTATDDVLEKSISQASPSPLATPSLMPLVVPPSSPLPSAAPSHGASLLPSSSCCLSAPLLPPAPSLSKQKRILFYKISVRCMP